MNGLLGGNLLSKDSIFGIPSKGVKNIQHGTLSIVSGQAWNSTVVSPFIPENSILYVQSVPNSWNTTAPLGQYLAGGTIYDGTTLRFDRGGTWADASVIIRWTLEEYMPGVLKSKQSGVKTTSGGTATIPITAVNLNKARIIDIGRYTTYTGGVDSIKYSNFILYFSSTSEITFQVESNIGLIVPWQAVEFN